MNPFLSFSSRVDVLPVAHGSGDFAVRVRDELLSNRYDCVAVPLPASFEEQTLAAVDRLPSVAAVTQAEPNGESATYVPIDPCQPVIMALRFALRERIATAFIDRESPQFESISDVTPDPFALKRLPLEKYLAAILPALPRPAPDSSADLRIRRMAFELHRLELEHERILFVPSLFDWPWIREAYVERRSYPEHEAYFSPIETHGVAEPTLAFFLGELPYVTALYERRRLTLDADDNLAIDGVKELALEARDRWLAKRDRADQWLTPKLLSLFLRYARNLTLLKRRLTPDLYTLVLAAKQVGGDAFALELLKTARLYEVSGAEPWRETLSMGIGEADLPGQGVTKMVSRLPGAPMTWRALELRPEPPSFKTEKWRIQWDPHKQCSWPAEDVRIESFHTHVRDQAKALMGSDLARTEKFTTSVKDGIDIRETLRNWHKKEIHVRDVPPARGNLEIVVFLFDTPADPAKYPWRTTWHAEHQEESTLGFFATDFREKLVGPGIGLATYGGVFFCYPPRYLPDIWTDPRLPQRGGLEERLLAAAVFHSRERNVAVISAGPLRASWRQVARLYRKKLIHLPLSRFSGRLVDRLRQFHVLNGKEVRSYAAHFIRGE